MMNASRQVHLENSHQRRIRLNIPFPKIPYYVVDDHNEALNCIYRAIGRQRLPLSGLALLHYDSHPDMCLPNIPPSTILSDSKSVVKAVSIEDWIFPAVYAQYIDTIIWIKPEWSKQMEPRPLTEYYIGPLKSNPNVLCVTCPDNYFVEDGSHAALEELENPVKFQLAVEWLHPMHTACKPCQDLIQYLRSRPFILDIDMDTFTCVNPLRRKFSHEQSELIDRLYGISAEDAAAQLPAHQVSQRQRENYAQLGVWMAALKEGAALPMDDVRAQLLQRLCSSVKGKFCFVSSEGDSGNDMECGSNDMASDGEESLDYLHYLWKGGWDQSESGLPHQVNNMQDIAQYIEAMESLLNRLENPKIITISRSHKDGYVPERHVEILEKVVIKSLEQVYGKKVLRAAFTSQSKLEAIPTSTGEDLKGNAAVREIFHIKSKYISDVFTICYNSQHSRDHLPFRSLSSALRANKDIGEESSMSKKGIH